MAHNAILAGIILAGTLATGTALGNALELQTPVTFTADEYFLKPEGWIEGWDSGCELNGCVVVAHRRLYGSGNDYSDYYITRDGVELEPGKVYRGVFGMVDGNVLATDQNGDTFIFDSGWNATETGLRLYYIRPLDGGRYFAVDDETMIDYSWARGVDGGDIVEKYALYRGTQKLTECKYDHITPTEGGFECVYTEDGVEKRDFYAASDIAPEPARRELVVWNQKFYLKQRN